MQKDVAVLVVLGCTLAVGIAFLVYWAQLERRHPAPDSGRRARPIDMAIGFVTNFFDTLGIGSFATTTAVYRLRRLVSDELIPGTLNVGHALPTVAQALIFIAAVQVEAMTLVSLIVAAVAGAWLGAGIVTRLPRRAIQAGMAVALLAAAVLFLLTIFEVVPGGGDAVGLSGPTLAIAIIGNLLLGALMSLGIGLYGPCLIMVSLLGMNPLAAFPIMMGSCAFLMPVSSLTFIRRRRYSVRAAVGLAIGGIPGVLIAAYIVKSLPLLYLRWLVVIVVLYTAITLLRTAIRPPRTEGTMVP